MQENEVDELEVCDEDSADFVVGENYIIQTATLWIFTGECVRVTESHVYFRTPSWVQEVGRFGAFFQAQGRNAPQSVEYMGDESILRVKKDTIVFDVVLHSIPTSTTVR
jgi:hypothetical protein